MKKSSKVALGVGSAIALTTVVTGCSNDDSNVLEANALESNHKTNAADQTEKNKVESNDKTKDKKNNDTNTSSSNENKDTTQKATQEDKKVSQKADENVSQKTDNAAKNTKTIETKTSIKTVEKTNDNPPKARVNVQKKDNQALNHLSVSNPTYTGIVDWMKDHKMDSSFDHRKELAIQNKINNYEGTATQNKKLLEILKGENKVTKATEHKKVVTNNDEKVAKSSSKTTPSEKVVKDNKSNKKVQKDQSVKGNQSHSEEVETPNEPVKPETKPTKPVKDKDRLVDESKNKDNSSEKESKKPEKPQVPTKPVEEDSKTDKEQPSKPKDEDQSKETPKEDVPSEPKEETPVEEPSNPVEDVKDKEETPSETPVEEQPEEPTQPEQPSEPKEEEPEQKPEQEPEKPADVVTTKTSTSTESIAFETVYQDDSSLEKGKEVVAQNGQDGVKTITYKETYKNGELVSKDVVSSEVTKSPVNKVVKVGTKEPDVITTKTSTSTESIAFETVYQEDSSLEKGKEVVAQDGQNGVKTITYKETYKNGELVSKDVVSSDVTKQPVNKIIKVGTKEVQTTPSASQAHSILAGSGMSKSGNTYKIDDPDYGLVIEVTVGNNGVSNVYYNATMYRSYTGMSEQDFIDILGPELGEETYQYSKDIQNKIEKAVRATANAVYGSGTSQANSLYSQIINSSGVFSKSF